MEAREKEKTGIRTLKIGYNKVFGYYIEVSNSFKDQVPDTYIRKQTLVNGERTLPKQLKDLGARDSHRLGAGGGAGVPALYRLAGGDAPPPRCAFRKPPPR